MRPVYWSVNHYVVWLSVLFFIIMYNGARAGDMTCADEYKLRSTVGAKANITFTNGLDYPVSVFWITYDGKRDLFDVLSPNHSITEDSYVTHPWVITNEAGKCLKVVFPNSSIPTVSIGNPVNSPIYDNLTTEPSTSDLSSTPTWEMVGIFGFGVTFVMVILSLSFLFPNPTPFQYTVCRIILALAASGVATLLPGTLDVKIPGYVTATAAFAVFVIVYFRTPAELVRTQVSTRTTARRS